MPALWAEPHVRFAGNFTGSTTAASTCARRWGACRSVRRARRSDFPALCKYGDGYTPPAYPAGQSALAAFAKLRASTREVSETGQRWGSKFGSPWGPAHQRIGGAKSSSGIKTGVTHVTAHTTYVSGHHKRIPGAALPII
jgi:hypothetical protein